MLEEKRKQGRKMKRQENIEKEKGELNARTHTTDIVLLLFIKISHAMDKMKLP